MSPATCWQISTEIPLGATCAALADSRSTQPLTFCTRSELAGCATPSGRREGSSADAACCTPVRDSSTSPGSSTSCQRARSRSDHGRPAAIILSMLPLIASHEKTEREGAPYKIFIHMLVTLQTVQQALHTHHTTRGTQRTDNATASQAAAGTAVRALSMRCRASPGPPGKTQAQARQGRPTDGHMRHLQRLAPQSASRSCAARLAAVAARRQLPVD